MPNWIRRLLNTLGRSGPADRSADAPAGAPERTPSEEYYGGVDRPAGPDAETMAPERLGGDQRPPGSTP